MKSYFVTDKMPRLWRGKRRPETGTKVDLDPKEAEYDLRLGFISATAPKKEPTKAKETANG